jgi:hypothetical protein
MKKILFLLSMIACGGQTIGDIDAGTGSDSGTKNDTGTTPKACTKDSDCGGTGICGFSEADACKATGQCFPQPGSVCNAFSPGCACDGSTINIVCNGLPDGYAPAPLAYKGNCAPDAGTTGPYTCGSKTCVEGQDICVTSANPANSTCVPSNGCTDCKCAQLMFQCVSQCKQNGPQIYVQCQ